MIPAPIYYALRAVRIVRLTLTVLLPIAFALGLAVHCAGCGGALAAQARAAAISTVALEGAHRVIVETHEARSSTCEDEACVLAVRESMRPVEAAHDTVRATLVAWVEALNIARLTGDSGDVIAAMVTAASRLLTEWSRLAESFRAVGIDLPTLPDVVLLAGGAQ